jgi:circadian clock protein KaiC
MSGGPLELSGLLIRLERVVAKTGPGTILVLDAFDVLFEGLPDRSQVRRAFLLVFQWASEHGVTIIGTVGEGPDYTEATDLVDYASDTIIRLFVEVEGGLVTRFLRVLKRRGGGHGANEYPFVIGSEGVSVMPVTETRMNDRVFTERLSTGVRELDGMMGGQGLWVGSAALISGRSGTGKSLLGASCALSALQKGKKALIVSFEEPPEQYIRGAASIGVDLRPFVTSGQLMLQGRRSVECGLEDHIIHILEQVAETAPDVVVLDPISAIADMGVNRAVKNSILRLVSAIREKGITLLMTELLADNQDDKSSLNVSSLVDTWIRLQLEEKPDRLMRKINVQKSRGMPTSVAISEFLVSDDGFRIKHLEDRADADPSEPERLRRTINSIQVRLESLEREASNR